MRLRLTAAAEGGALLVHPKGRPDERAMAFVRGLARDDLHTLVVVDLPDDAVGTAWPSVARLLAPARYRSLRLVFGRGGRADVRQAAAGIADRLGREVLAPDGELTPTVTGGLFVPAHHGEGWLRYRPGRAAERDSQRFPKPSWEFSAPVRPRPLGPHAVAEPLPCGVWVRSTRAEPSATDRRRLVEAVPADPDLLLVVVGGPGAPRVALDDLARFWATVLPGARPATRFVLHGALDVPDGTEPGPALAAALGYPVVRYAELPRAVPVAGGGAGGAGVWRPEEVLHLPAPPPAGGTGAPVGWSASGGSSGSQGWSAPGGAPGPAAEPPLSSDGPDGGPDGGAEPRRGAGGAAGPGPTAVLVSGGPGGEPGPVAPATPAAPVTATTADGPLPPSRRGPVSVAPASSDTPSAGGSAGDVPAPRGPARPAPTGPARPDGDEPGGLPGPADPTPSAAGPSPAPAVDLAAEPDRGSVPGRSPASAVVPEVRPAGAADHGSVPAESQARAEAPEPGSAVAPELRTATVQPPAPAPVRAERPARAPAPSFRLESGGPAPVPEPAPGPSATPAPPTPAREPSAAARPPAAPSAESAPALIRVQPTPTAAACAVPPERGIDQERNWVRRTFSAQFNAIAGSVSRAMSEAPGLRAADRAEAAAALTELAAVRLYLGGDTGAADAAVRGAAPGAHVPLARCVAAGLRRLPSYRGPALLRTRLTDAERALYREGGLLTEWAFCHARTTLRPGPPGATDVLIWSMTARRTALLDPEPPDRVLFLPGTGFKVLRVEGRTVMLRELSPSETAADGRADAAPARLDALALAALERIPSALAGVGTDEGAECTDPPGLLSAPRPSAPRPSGSRTSTSRPSTSPTEGARP
ncbi:hypothetical protein [Kitasatospora sp. A2-31]|uniref:hypothetical protein n=1 Tax=Kitasatospora sp. A2-31 TaxID=2916414 RepID=UPI001EEB7DB7|nr:hypothetical protein [Kitasatospora sp. A2-31]MCG6495626.1 hypothetical protein [Kitasatospora sp. A2-31]